MTDRRLQYILTIAEEGSLTGAAEKLFISQPSLSALLAKVEADYGAKLFERNTTPARLTYAGECYAQAARRILGIEKELRETIVDIQNEETGKLALGAGAVQSALLFPLIIPVFMNRYPKIQLKLLENSQSLFEKMLMADILDLAFSSMPVYNDNIQNLPLYSEEVILFTPASLSLSKSKVRTDRIYPVCDMAELKGQPFVLFKKGRYLRHASDRLFADSKIAPHIILETDNWETCYGMVEKGLACTLLPYSPFKQAYIVSVDINRYCIKSKPLRTISLCYKKRASLSKNTRRFIDLSEELIKQFINAAVPIVQQMNSR